MKTMNDRAHAGESLTITWGVSKGRDTYGYTTATLRNGNNKKIAGCNGGGYDMRGTVVGNWLTWAFADRLRALKPSDMPAQSHWEPSRNRVCVGLCKEQAEARFYDALNANEGAQPETMPDLAPDCWECPTCKGKTRQSYEGKRVEDGRYFYGLTFHDPNYDPGKAVVGTDCSNRTIGGESGKTVEELEAEGKSLGLERYQAVYRASSHHATERHTIPSIDGACGLSSVLRILQAIGFELDHVVNKSKLDVFVVREHKPEPVTA